MKVSLPPGMKLPNDSDRRRKIISVVAVVLMCGVIGFSEFLKTRDVPDSVEPVTEMQPILSAHDFADRVFYADGGTREWGTWCRWKDGQWFSVHHVTVNGTPVVGPQAQVTASNELNDWSTLNIDPTKLKAEDFPVMSPGVEGFIAGFPAVDRDGEIVPGRVYMTDTNPAFVWVELTIRDDGGHPEGVVGGISGSCFIVNGKVAGVVHANGFSKIEGTTNTWALVVPIRTIINDVNGVETVTPSSFLKLPLPEKAPL